MSFTIGAGYNNKLRVLVTVTGTADYFPLRVLYFIHTRRYKRVLRPKKNVKNPQTFGVGNRQRKALLAPAKTLTTKSYTVNSSSLLWPPAPKKPLARFLCSSDAP